MLTSLELIRYRGFHDHKVPLRDSTIVVGRNNAGKSTIVEAVRLVAIVVNRAPFLLLKEPPEWTDIPLRYRGVSPSLKGMDFDFRTLSYRYGDEVTKIKAGFSSGTRVSIFLNAEEQKIFAVFFTEKNMHLIINRSNHANLVPRMSVQPGVGPLASEERILNEEYVRSHLDTRLTPLHFRNQLAYFRDEHFDKFVEMAEGTWPGLGINGLERGVGDDSALVQLFVRDGTFVAEVGNMGHGLQTWLQTVWFLTRTPKDATIVLDEPDVYLHADLQRKLIRLLRGAYRQVIVATHSLEIVADVSPSSILIVDKERKNSKFADGINAVQNIIENIGGVQNIQLTRFWAARKCLIVEGDDHEILKEFFISFFPKKPMNLTQFRLYLWAVREIGGMQLAQQLV